MLTLPQLLAEDVERLEGVLKDLLARSDANAALIIDKAGFIIAHTGKLDHMDFTTLAALAAGSFMANEQIADIIREGSFSSVYQQGESTSLLVQNVNEQVLLVVVFKATVGVGAVKYYAGPAIEQVVKHLKTAQARDPDRGMDLSLLNIADTASYFRRRTS